jgi:SulP family sulfate permease
MKPKILSTLPGYTPRAFAADALAGLTVALVALPLSLAIAIASGASPDRGFVTAIVAGFLISALGGSRVQIGGPTGAFIVVVFSVIAKHGIDGLILATLLAGIILFIAGTFRAGRLIAMVPEPVINGFTIGIGIIIGTSQLKDFFGLTLADVPAEFIPKIAAFWGAHGTFSAASFGIGLLTLLLIIGLRRTFPRFPGLIVAVGVSAAVVTLGALPVETIASRFGELPRNLPLPALPDISYERVVELLPSAFVIAFLAGVESLLSAIVADRMFGGAHRPNAELRAQGVANIASSLFGGLPATGAIARTATNVRAGGRTPVAGIVHALVLLLIMWVAAPLAGMIPMPALAALLIVTAWTMSEPHRWPGYLKGRGSDIMLLVLTLALTVLIDLTVAIGVGVAVGLALRLLRSDADGPDWTPRDR